MSSNLWIYGVIVALAGSVGNNVGNNLVSLGHKNACQKKLNLNNKDRSINTEISNSMGEENSEIEVKQRDWRTIGTVIFVFANILTFASFGLGSQSLMAALDSAQFVSNVFFVYFVHHERITVRMLIATLGILGGNILVVIYAKHGTESFNSAQMINLYKTNTAYHVYMIGAFCMWAITSYVYTIYHRSRMENRILLKYHNLLEPLCYALSSSIIGTQAVLNSKCMALLITSTLGTDKNEFKDWYIWFILGTWLLLVSYWLRRLDMGLLLFPPQFIIPVMQVFFVVLAIICGGIYFEEFIGFSISEYAGFTLGVVLIIIGVYLLAPPDMQLYIPPDPNQNLKTLNNDDEDIESVHTESHRHSDTLKPGEMNRMSSMKLEKKLASKVAGMMKPSSGKNNQVGIAHNNNNSSSSEGENKNRRNYSSSCDDDELDEQIGNTICTKPQPESCKGLTINLFSSGAIAAGDMDHQAQSNNMNTSLDAPFTELKNTSTSKNTNTTTTTNKNVTNTASSTGPIPVSTFSTTIDTSSIFPPSATTATATTAIDGTNGVHGGSAMSPAPTLSGVVSAFSPVPSQTSSPSPSKKNRRIVKRSTAAAGAVVAGAITTAALTSPTSGAGVVELPPLQVPAGYLTAAAHGKQLKSNHEILQPIPTSTASVGLTTNTTTVAEATTVTITPNNPLEISNTTSATKLAPLNTDTGADITSVAVNAAASAAVTAAIESALMVSAVTRE